MSSPDQNQPPAATTARNARAEAQRLLGSSGSARVLEPSPPAHHDPPYFADDPVDPAESAARSGPVVLPAGMAAGSGVAAAELERTDWNQWLAGHPEHSQWVADHWLGGERRLPPAPPTLVDTRTALHRLAAYVIAPVRHQANGKFGLRWTKGGFGTPFFGDDRQVRVDGNELVDQRGDTVRRAAIGSLQAAADFLGSTIDPDTAAEHDSPPVGDRHADLDVDAAAVRFLDGWFGMAFAALELVRADETSVDSSRPQLWPGHFDPAIEVGTDDTRASYGASPGDHGSDEPYLYVSVWWPDRVGLGGTTTGGSDTEGSDTEGGAADRGDTASAFWNGEGFVGRVLKLGDFPADTDPVEVAATFWRETRDALHR
ncbi:MAG: hypothetical protein OER95_14620 [Acidimicrobiia bacterium]|nr:hypothetical protein [Acidimicrobiia bacterium]